MDQNITEITAAYEGGWNKLTEKFYAKMEWPEAEIIAPLVGDGVCFSFFGIRSIPCMFIGLLIRSHISDSIPRAVLPVCYQSLCFLILKVLTFITF